MPTWTSQPPAADPNVPYRILRTPANKPLTAIATSTDPIGTNTHYLKNRTIPCNRPQECQACQEGISWRWHGYVAALLTDTLEHFLFEFTANAANTFKSYMLLYNNLRGCHFRAQRPSGKSNGRVVIACKPGDQQRLLLPEPPNVARILCHIWGVPYNAPETFHVPDRLGTQIGVITDSGNGRSKPKTPKEA